jgi:hypothetical protein
MAYIIIPKTKFGDCSNAECGRKDVEVVKVGKSLFCIYCRKNQKNKMQLEKAKERQSLRQLIKTKENIKIAERNIPNMSQKEIDVAVKNELELWFSKIRLKEMVVVQPYNGHDYSGGNCWECGVHIPATYFRAATAHVLPKRKEYGFPSVSVHPKNYLILGAGCGCHDRYDRSWEDASKMKIWGEAVKRFKEIYPFIKESEHKNIPEVLLSTLNTQSHEQT